MHFMRYPRKRMFPVKLHGAFSCCHYYCAKLFISVDIHIVPSFTTSLFKTRVFVENVDAFSFQRLLRNPCKTFSVLGTRQIALKRAMKSFHSHIYPLTSGDRVVVVYWIESKL